jgi:hypothetical protein
VQLDGVEPRRPGIRRGSGIVRGDVDEFVGGERTAARLAGAADAGRADGGDSVGVVPLPALMPELRGDHRAVGVHCVRDGAPPGHGVVADERGH